MYRYMHEEIGVDEDATLRDASLSNSNDRKLPQLINLPEEPDVTRLYTYTKENVLVLLTCTLSNAHAAKLSLSF